MELLRRMRHLARSKHNKLGIEGRFNPLNWMIRLFGARSILQIDIRRFNPYPSMQNANFTIFILYIHSVRITPRMSQRKMGLLSYYTLVICSRNPIFRAVRGREKHMILYINITSGLHTVYRGSNH